MAEQPPRPIRIGIIGGTGLADALGGEAGEERDLDTPFGRPSAPIKLTEWNGQQIALLKRHGEGHVYNPSAVPYRANIFALKSLGVTHILASGATGSLQEHVEPGHLVIADQAIDKTWNRPNTFFETIAGHVEFSEPFCPTMRQWLRDAAGRLGEEYAPVHDGGTYVCMEGPQFSTRAESLMHQQWGGHVVGMTAMPEAKLAREAEIAYALIAMPTDYDCWRPTEPDVPQHQLLEQIIANLKQTSANNVALMKAALHDITLLKAHRSPAHDALALGLWTDKSRIDPAEIERLRPIWGRYFQQ